MNIDIAGREGELLLTLIATIAIELLVLIALRERRVKVLLACVAVNILTNVPLNIYVMTAHPGWQIIILAELLVVIIEMLWYYLFIRNLAKAAVYSYLCNAISFLLGLLVTLLTLFFF